MLCNKFGDIFGYILEKDKDNNPPIEYTLTIFYETFKMSYKCFNMEYKNFDIQTFLDLESKGFPTYDKRYEDCKCTLKLSSIVLDEGYSDFPDCLSEFRV